MTGRKCPARLTCLRQKVYLKTTHSRHRSWVRHSSTSTCVESTRKATAMHVLSMVQASTRLARQIGISPQSPTLEPFLYTVKRIQPPIS